MNRITKLAGIALVTVLAGCQDLPRKNPLQGMDLNRNQLEIQVIQTIGGEQGNDIRFRWPYGLTTDSLGNVYVADKENHRIQILLADSGWNVSIAFGGWGSGEHQFKSPTDILYNPPTRHLIVADFGNNRLKVHKLNGELVQIFQPGLQTVIPFDRPRGLWRAPTGEICVTCVNSKSVICFDDETFQTGAYFQLDNRGATIFKYPRDMVIMSPWGWIVSDKDAHQLIAVNPGTVKTYGKRGSEPYQFWEPAGLELSAIGYLFVADSRNHRIQCFDQNLRYIGQWQGAVNIPLKYPMAVHIDQRNQLWIVDSGNHRILRCTYHIR